MTAPKHKDSDEELLWTISDAAKHLAVHTRTVSRLIDKGTLPSVRVGRCLRIPKRFVLEWIEEQTRYNSSCAGSVVQGASTCHISAGKVRSGGRLTQMQTERELDALLKPPTARKRKP